MTSARVLRSLTALALATVALVGADQPTITVFAAASTTDALGAIAKDYEAAHGVKVVCSFGASSTLAKQIGAGGAPADVFLSADQKWMDTLADQKAIQTDSRRDILGNRLVLITPAGAKAAAISVDKAFAIADAFSGRLAIADPAGVPAGRYAQEAFTKLGWWTALESRLAPAADVRAALRLVELGECALGVVYASDAAVSPKVAVAAEIPENLHTPIRYPVALTTIAKPEAAAFVAHLSSPASAAVFAKAGFRVIEMAPAAK